MLILRFVFPFLTVSIFVHYIYVCVFVEHLLKKDVPPQNPNENETCYDVSIMF